MTQWLENNYTASDNCTLENVSFDYVASTLDVCTASTTLVTWTATDACGNSMTATSNLIVIPDTENPMISTTADLTLDCSNISATTDASALVTQWLETNYTASDNCSLSDVSFDYAASTLDVCTASTTLVTWTATDACGNTMTATSNLVVIPDTENPMISTTADLTLDCSNISATTDASGLVTQWLETNYTASDNCSLSDVSFDYAASTLDVCTASTTLVTWTATDACGNTMTATSNLIVIPDTEVPDLTIPATALALDCGSIGENSSPTVEILNW